MIAKLKVSSLKWTLESADVESGVRSLIYKFGVDAVKEAVKRITKPKEGRKPEPDSLELEAVHKSDAELLLIGKDPFTLTSNRSIAKVISERLKGHSVEATKRRIMKKLQTKRIPQAHYLAAILSKDKGHVLHLNVLKTSIKVVTGVEKEILSLFVKDCRREVKRYVELLGKNPDNDLLVKQLQQINNEAEQKKRSISFKMPQGLLGIKLGQ